MVDSQKRIAGAFLVGALLVAVAFVMSRTTNADTLQEGKLIAAIVEREHIDVDDTNGDGVPNWQDSLVNGEPIILPTASSTYTPPETVTGKFAISFFENLLRSKTQGAFGDTHQELAAEATKRLESQAIDELFTREDITVFPSDDPQSIHAYANHIATILLAHPNTGDNEALILQDALRYEDDTILEKLDPIALSYTTMVKKMLEAPVPDSYIQKHLDLLNSLNAIREDVRGMQKIKTDALYTLLRMKRYEDDVLGLTNALSNLFTELSSQERVIWSKDEPASKLNSMINAL